MKVNHWEILREIGKNNQNATLIECRCDCGIIKIQQKSAVIHGRTLQCANCSRLSRMEKKHIGKVFNKLTIIDQLPGKKCICLCKCGNKKTFQTQNVLLGTTISCGCAHKISRSNYLEDMKKKLMASIKIMPNGCWEWQKSKKSGGYGNFPFKGNVLLAHRVSWMIFREELDDSIYVCHKCDNPSCCNPDHLFLGTNSENILDAFKKGRIVRPKGENHYFHKFTSEQILEIRKLCNAGVLQKKIAKIFNVHPSQISAIFTRKSWKHL